MKKLLLGLTVMALIFMVGGIAYAGTTAAQTFNVQISEINELTVSGNPGGMTVSASSGVSAGNNPSGVSEQSTTYSITTNGTNKKLTGQITSGGDMPTNITLSLWLQAPTTGTNVGNKDMNTSSAQNLVTGISTVADGTSNMISWQLTAQASAGTYTQTSKTITLTLCAM